MTHPARLAADGLTAHLDTALSSAADDAQRRRATLDGLAAAVGLLAMLLADEAEQVAEVGRLMTDLQATDAEPEQAVASLGLLIARHALGSREEAARALATAWQQHRGQPLAAGARLLVLTVSWLDAEGAATRLLGRAELALDDGQPPELALDSALRALCALLAATPPEPAVDPLRSAFDAAVAAARQLATSAA
ncbi:MAG: hypothetical protein HZB16_07690 [Armatimonadetes bacterium]|nr:hypothetical protein [Armatimonadota bacterium]